MSRFFVKMLLIALLFAGQVCRAEGLGIIDIAGAEVEPIPTAIPTVKLTPRYALTSTSGDPPNVVLSEALRKDLAVVAEFRVLDPVTYLEDPKTAPLVPDAASYSDWQLVGAELLIKGQIDKDKDEIIVELYAYDVLEKNPEKKFLTGKRYRTVESGIRTVAHMFANHLMEQMTGKFGPLNTEIAYTVKKGATKNIARSEVTGGNYRLVTDNNSINVNPVWSRNGARLYMTSYYGGTPDLCRVNLAEGTQLYYFYRGEGVDIPGQESPDGRFLAFAATVDNNVDIYVMELATKAVRRLTSEASIEVSPCWSPDGAKLVFVSDRAGSPQLYIMGVDRATPPTRLTFNGRYNSDPAWSPDGSKIAFSSIDDNRIFQLGMINSDGSSQAYITATPYDTYDPSWSPDGRFLAITSMRDGNEAVFVLRLGANYDKVWQVSPKGVQASQPSWSHGPVAK